MQLSSALKETLIKTAHLLADAAGEAILPHFRSLDLPTDNKDSSGYDPVTVADRAAEKAMRKVLAELRPEDAILGEEFGHKAGTSGLTWVLDPIDGTRAFVCGAPTWGVLVAVNAGAAPLFGLIDQPFTQERYSGGFGEALWQRGSESNSIATRAAKPLSEAILLTTFPEIGSPEQRRTFERVRDRVQLTRYGLDCYGYALLAAGQVDLVIEAGLAPYDIQGPMAIVEAAGGVVTDWEGGPADGGGTVIAAANAEIHAEALSAMQA
ncbi:MAG: histidinol-phosphatase [Pseudomonadota bacterium]